MSSAAAPPGPRGDVLAAAVAAGLPDRLARRVAAYAPVTHAGGSPAVVACDLDRTLIYSSAALGLLGADAEAPPLVVAEVWQGAPWSFLTRDADVLLTALAEAATFVPTTTRTRAQYARVRLGARHRYAITANGAQILVDGLPCRDWAGQVSAIVAQGCCPLPEVVDHLGSVTDDTWLRSRRTAEDLFAYLVVERSELPPAFVAELGEWCAPRGWTVSLQGRKIYCVPTPLTKSAALAEVTRRVGAVTTYAAGDSLLDAELLAGADVAIRPAHGELHDSGWHLPHVRVTQRSGVLAGEEIAARLLAAVLGDQAGG